MSNKFGARRAEHGDHSHPSTGERYRCHVLHLLQESGEIRNLVLHPPFPLVVNGQRVGRYTADWMYDEPGPCGEWVTVVEDFKGAVTQKETAYRLRKRLFEILYPFKLRETHA